VNDEAIRLAAAAAGVTDLVAVSKPQWGLGTIQEALEGTMLIAGQSLRFGFWLPSGFPAVLPKVFALSPEARRLPHVDGRGFVCAFEDENTLLDYRLPAELVRETIERARSVVEDGLLGRNRADFLEEFEAYWPRGTDTLSALTPGDQPYSFKASYDGSRLVAVADTSEALALAFRGATKQLRNGLYLPLDGEALGVLHPLELCSWSAVSPLLSGESLRLARTMRVSKKQTLPLVLGISRKGGGRALVGLSLRKFSLDSWLIDAQAADVVPFTLTRFDDVRVRERLVRGASGPRIAVIGCGAVGGHVAHALAWSGAGELVLIDPDSCDAANTFRHVLGRSGWGCTKVVALKRELERCVPGLKVVAVSQTVGNALAAQPELLSSVDLVVVAIGNHSVPLQLNDTLAASRGDVPVIFTWLEPYGIGGHAVLVNYRARGCLRCLFDDESKLQCVIEFAEPGQRFGRRQVGCHGLYTPYADLDARTTALLAARLGRRALGDRAGAGHRRSWRGDASAFRAAGFRLNPRNESELDGVDTPIEPRPGCASCGR
jgi:hypothetical protein